MAAQRTHGPADRTRRIGGSARLRQLLLSAVRLGLGSVLVGGAVGAGLPGGGRAVLVTLGAAVSAALGLAAVVAGLVLGTRGLRGARRAGVVVLAVPAVLVVVGVVAVPVRASLGEPASAVATTPRGLGPDVRDVTLTTTDGARLAAWYVPSRTGAAVVLLHGSGSSRGSVLPHAAALVEHGYGVLLVDARGHGGSTGRAMLWGWYGDEDVPRAVDFLAARSDVDPGRIGVVGLSMGGEEALGAAALAPRVRAVVAEGVTGRSAADLGWLTDAYGWRGTLTQGVHGLQTAVAGVLTSADRPPPLSDAVQRLRPGSVLLVAAGEVPDEQHAARALDAAAPATVDVWVARHAGHTRSLLTDPVAWEARVVGFLDDALRP